MLWRIKDCEELLKDRVSTRKLNDEIKTLESRLSAKCEFDNETLHGRLMKVFDTCSARIKTAEIFTKDKFFDCTTYIKTIDVKIGAMPTLDHIAKIYDAQRLLKANFVNEFASF